MSRVASPAVSTDAPSVFSLRSAPSTAPTCRRVLIIYCGGTMGMKWMEGHGYSPVSGYLHSILSSLPYFNSPFLPSADDKDNIIDSNSNNSNHCSSNEALLTDTLYIPASLDGPPIRYQVLEHNQLLDSSNMTMDDWRQIAAELECWYDRFDGFVVIHGTDTMAYTAAALSFMLEGLAKPVVLTGSQIPFSELRSDATDNLLGALLVAAHHPDIHEVVVYFRNRLFRGNRVVKHSNDQLTAFESPNYPPVGEAGVRITVRPALLWHRNTHRHHLTVHRHLEPNVAVVRLFPGMSADALRGMLAAPLRGVVLVTFGSGNMPNNRPDLIAVLEEALVGRGVVAVNVSQCARGAVPTSALYATGTLLDRVGVVSGSDMTVECALAKLSFLLAQPELTTAVIRRQLGRSLRGELSEPWRDAISAALVDAVHRRDRDHLRQLLESCGGEEEVSRVRPFHGMAGFTLLHLAAYTRFAEGVAMIAEAAPILTQIRDATGRLYSDLHDNGTR